MSYEQEKELRAELTQLMKAEEAPTEEQKQPEQGNVVEGSEPPIQETKAPEVEMSEVEKKARELGWKSKEEREAEGKDNAHYVEPDEYVRRQPLFQRISDQTSELRALKERQRQYEMNLSKVRQEAYDQAFRDLESKRDAAMDDFNKEEVRRLDQQQRDLQRQMSQDPIINVPEEPTEQPKIQYSKEVLDLNETTKTWYNDDNIENKKMKAAADAVGRFIVDEAKLDGVNVDTKQYMTRVIGEVQKLFPHRFSQPAKSNTNSHTTTVGKSTVASDNKLTPNLVDRMTPQQREIAEQFRKDNSEFTLEKYAEELNRIGRLGK